MNKEILEIKNIISSNVLAQRRGVEDIKQKILNEVESKIKYIIDEKLTELRAGLERQANNSTSETFDPPQLNYLILPPEDTANFNENKSAIFIQIPFNSSKLHVLGLKNKQLYWIETEDCS